MPTWYRALSAPAANRPAHGTPQQAPGGGTAAHASSRHPSNPGSMRTPHSQHTSPRARIQQAPAYERPPRAAANRSPGIPFSGEVGARCEQPASHFPQKRHRLLGEPHRTATFSSQFSPIWNCMTPARRETLSANSHITPKRHSRPAPLSQFATFRHLPCPRHPRSQPRGVRYTAAKRPRMPQATVQRAGGGLPMRHISPRCCEFPGLRESWHPNFCEFPGLCERNAPARAGFPGCAKNPIRITRKTHTHQVLMPTPAN